MVHGSLDQPAKWQYVFDKHAAAGNFANQSTNVCFFRHTHVPMAFIRDGMVRGGTYTKFRIEEGPKYFINPGSVGQPRDGTTVPTYATYDVDSGVVELRRLEGPS